MRFSRPQYVPLFLLLLVAIGSLTYYFASATASLDQLYNPGAARLPLYFGFRLNVVSGNTLEGYRAGVRWGDTVLAINGRPFTGYKVLVEELRKAHAGGALSVTFSPMPSPAWVTKPPGAQEYNYPGHRDLNGDTAPRTVDIQLQQATPQRPNFFRLFTQFYFLVIIFPLGCLLLAIWAVFSRPNDKNAWFMLGILVYFAGIFSEAQHWGGPLYAFTTLWSQTLQLIGPLAIMLFGLYFPERARLDQRFPWIKWIVIGAAALMVPLDVAWVYGFGFHFAAVHWLTPILLKYYQVQTLIGMAAISLYFSALAKKLSTTAQPDLLRRLRILYWGSTVGCLPLFFVILYSLLAHRDLGDGIPSWLLLAAVLLFTLFPISLAYVVIVHRAMELRVLLRQGTKYALARTSIWLIRAAIGAALYFSVARLAAHHPFRLVDEVDVLALAVLFLVFRFRAANRLSLWIDRKFFREAYSSEQVLAELATQALSFTDTQPLMQTVSGCISKALHVDRIAILLRTGDVFRLQLATGVNIDPDLMLAASSGTIAGLARANGHGPIQYDNPEAWSLATTDAERAALTNLGAEVLIPLQGRNRLIGVLALGPKRSEEPYTSSDRSLLQSVALHTGLAIENSDLVRSLASEAAHRERINREMEIAREVQERMFPQSLPMVPGLDFAGRCRPALGVGGDYYDFFELKERPGGSRPLGIAIGDVSGKGISAALLMASLRASLRGMTRTSGDDLAAVIGDVNQLVFEASATNRYATFFYAQYDPREGVLRYVNAGHNAPVLLRAGGPAGNQVDQLLRLEASGPVIGLLQDAEYQECSMHMEPGDILLAFTDGISESMAVDEVEWGEDRMIECLKMNASLPAAGLLETLLEEATLFASGAPQFDDMTLLVFKFGASNGIP